MSVSLPPPQRSRVEEFFCRLATASECALFLDYDATIAPFPLDLDRAYLHPEVAALLQRILGETATRLVLITGRAARNLRSLIALSPTPEIWGSYGLERLLPNGDYTLTPVDGNQIRALLVARNAIVSANLGSRLEHNPASMALHLRGLAPAAAEHARNIAIHAWKPIAENTGLQLGDFDGRLELSIPNRDKGDAVRSLIREMDENSIVAYLGDDQTDEGAFRAMRPQDLAVLVCEEFRETCVHTWIRPPEELLRFLGDWLLACGGVL